MSCHRWYLPEFRAKLARPWVHILFGARQTGKSTLIDLVAPPDAIRLDLSHPGERARLAARPEEFVDLCEALPARSSAWTIIVDEAQAVPALFDAVQHLFDRDRTRWRFILCGSSARKLRRSGANLLPGRSFLHRLWPLTLSEQPPAPRMGETKGAVLTPLPFPPTHDAEGRGPFPSFDLETRLAVGALPGIVLAEAEDRAELLASYVTAYLEEEIRREAAVKDWGAFLRFLQFAAQASGEIINHSSIAREAGVSVPTVKNYYQLLEDMFIGIHLPAFTSSPRKNLLTSPRFLFFDLGVRHAAAGLPPSRETVLANPGPLFEQFVGLELWRRLQYLGRGRLLFLRSADGAEIDYVIEDGERLIPIEVKWTERPGGSDTRHLRRFLADHPGRAETGWVICRCPRPLRLAENILAIPWQML